MKEFKLILGKLSIEKRKEILSYFTQGKIAVLPTDTVYGISARADCIEARNRINKIKERSDKSFIVLVSDILMIKKYCQVSKEQEKYIREMYLKNTKAITIILQAKKDINLTNVYKDGSIALRLPKRPFLIKIIKDLGLPIISTSLNISNREIVKDPETIKKGYFKKDKVDFIINEGVNNKNKSSKLIDIRNIDDIKIIRE